ncbi:MAG: sulfurtransferase complex subunit TusD [Pseudomonadota bacterium]
MKDSSFTLLVTGSPFTGQAHYSAMNFCEAIYQKQCRINCVFFYQDAVLVASCLNDFDGKVRLQNSWASLAKKYQFNLDVCVAAAVKRGVYDQEEMQRDDKLTYNLAEGFQLSGLGVLVESMSKTTRTVEFK